MVPTSYTFDKPPRFEAKMLLPLLRLPRENIQTVRALIAISEIEERELRRDEKHADKIITFRRNVLHHFDILCGLIEPDPKPTQEVKAPKTRAAKVRSRCHLRTVIRFRKRYGERVGRA
jgi:hypothetical protein